jgi:hypothetical protein
MCCSITEEVEKAKAKISLVTKYLGETQGWHDKAVAEGGTRKMVARDKRSSLFFL